MDREVSDITGRLEKLQLKRRSATLELESIENEISRVLKQQR